MSAVTSDGAPPGSRYGDQRPYVVAEQLDDLHGPTTGVVELDRSLDWSARVRYDLDNPPREDLAPFAYWERHAFFPAAVDEVMAAYQAEGYEVTVDLRLDTFTRLHLTDPAYPTVQLRVELVANWRAQPPVVMDVGPV